MSKIKFYSFALSPFALKVQSYLLYLDIDFDTVFVNPLKIKLIAFLIFHFHTKAIRQTQLPLHQKTRFIEHKTVVYYLGLLAMEL